MMAGVTPPPGPDGSPGSPARPGSRDRHHRQALLPGIGPEGQARIAGSSVLVAGCGALGGVLAETLCRAGVGRLVLVDRDVVEETNLQRQVLFADADARAGRPKAVAAAGRLRAIDPAVEVEAHATDLTAANAEALCGVRGGGRRVDCIADGLDHFGTRFLLDDLSVKHAVPYAYGGAVGSSGTALCLLPRTADRETPWERRGVATPTLRELVPEPPAAGSTPTCDTAGVLGPLIHAVAGFQAAEVLKVLVGDWEAVNPRLWHADLWANRSGFLDVSGLVPERPRADFGFLEAAPRSAAAVLCGRGAVQVSPAPGAPPPGLPAVAAGLPAGVQVLRENEHLLRFTAGGPEEFTLFADGRCLVRGTDDPARARALVARLLGG